MFPSDGLVEVFWVNADPFFVILQHCYQRADPISGLCHFCNMSFHQYDLLPPFPSTWLPSYTSSLWLSAWRTDNRWHCWIYFKEVSSWNLLFLHSGYFPISLTCWTLFTKPNRQLAFPDSRDFWYICATWYSRWTSFWLYCVASVVFPATAMGWLEYVHGIS